MRAVLFDAVGTLIRPAPAVGSVYARAAAAAGLRCGARAIEAAFLRSYGELAPGRFFGRSGLRTSEARERRWWRAVVARTLERAGCGRAPAAAVEGAFAAFGRGAAWRLLPGALATLRALRRRGVRLAVVSNYDARLHRVVRELGLLPLLDLVVVSSEAGWAKPSPRIFRAALAALGTGAAETAHVGDRVREDLEGARGAGLRALLYDPQGRHPSPDAIRDLRSVLPRLGLGRRPV